MATLSRTVDGDKPEGEDPHGHDPHGNDQLRELLVQLKNAYRLAGEPSYRSIAMLAGRRLSASTISRIFNATSTPKWRNLALLLTAIGVSPENLEAVWHPMWVRAMNRADPITETTLAAHPPLSPGTQDKSCPECGASVADPEIHARWHDRLGRAGDLLEALERYAKRPAHGAFARATPGRAPRARGAGPGARDGQ